MGKKARRFDAAAYLDTEERQVAYVNWPAHKVRPQPATSARHNFQLVSDAVLLDRILHFREEARR